VVRDYELMYIVRPELDDEALRTATESVDTLIRGLGGTVGKTTMWGKRRLAYEVDRLRDGHYVITLLQLDGTRVADLERALQIHDTVFRHLLVRGDETVPAAEEGAEAEAGNDGPVAEAALPGGEDDAAAEEGAEAEAGNDGPVAEAALPGGEDDAADDAVDEDDTADDAADEDDDAADEDDDAPAVEIAAGDEE
jgi:small subunit ribosomal protein S6